MESFTIGFTKQLRYVRKVLSDRNTHSESFEASLKNVLFAGEPTALEVYIHGVSSLFWAAQKLRFPTMDDQQFVLAISPESDVPLMTQMIDVYQEAIDALTAYLGSITKDALKTKIPSPFGSGEIRLLDYLGINIHHTAGHVAQALRLQALYLRHQQ